MIDMSETVELDRASDPQAVRGYALFDWGKSAFETSVTVAILPAWFAYLFLKANGLTTTIGSIEMTGDAIWSFSVTAAALLFKPLTKVFLKNWKFVRLRFVRMILVTGNFQKVLKARMIRN